MNKELITACMPVLDRPARVTVLYEEGRPAEVYVEPRNAESVVGKIILGKVESVSAGLSAAFVRIGSSQRVYLPLTKSPEQLRPGDEMPVQIVQDAQKSKLPKASAAWEIAGRYLVVTPGSHGVTFSRRLSAEDKTVLRRMAAGWRISDCAVLFRTAAAETDPEEVREEFLQLCETVRDIQGKAATRPCYTVLYQAPGVQHRIISRCGTGELSRFLTDDTELAGSMKEVCAAAGCESELYRDPQIALFRLRSLSTLLDRVSSRVVPLRSGGSLIIEQTEAFAVIDVNSARYTGKHDPEETIRKINCEAAVEAARQIRLRQLSGTILIDFINSRDMRHEAELAHILSTEFFRDPVYSRVIDFTKLHICEITRRKIQRPLSEQLRSIRG